MTHDEAAAIVKRLTYRPGWTIEFYMEPAGSSVLRVGTVEPDAERPGAAPMPVVYTSSIKPADLARHDLTAFLRWVYGVFHLRVEHELREWLRLDGHPLIEPHPEKWSRGVLPESEVGSSPPA